MQGRVHLGDDAFCAMGNVRGELKDVATRYTFGDPYIDASKCVCGSGPIPAGEAYSTPPDPLAGFGEGRREKEEWKRLRMAR